CHTHRATGGETQLATRLLLQGARSEGRSRVAGALGSSNVRNAVASTLQIGQHRLRLGLVAQRVFLAIALDQLRAEDVGLAGLPAVELLGEIRLERPILDRHERLDLALAVDNQAQRD